MPKLIHNVSDRRRAWISPWEVEDELLDISKLQPSDVGRTVIYVDSAGSAEAGTLSSWNSTTVFARFSRGDTSAACNPSDLRFAIRDASADYYRPPSAAQGNS